MNEELIKEDTKATNGGYYAIHQWLRLHYGKADKCDNTDCLNNTSYFEWALLKGRKHEHKRENYLRLCKPCHSIYDGIDRLTGKRFWKGGKPKCLNCKEELKTYVAQRCRSCNNKQRHGLRVG